MVILIRQIHIILHTEQLPLEACFPKNSNIKKRRRKGKKHHTPKIPHYDILIFYIASIAKLDHCLVSKAVYAIYTFMYKDFHRMLPIQKTIQEKFVTEDVVINC